MNDDDEIESIKKKLREWIDDNKERKYKLSKNADKIIMAMIRKKKNCGYDRYYCPCRVVKENDEQYKNDIECNPCIFVRNPELAKDGIEKNGRCHCNLIVKITESATPT